MVPYRIVLRNTSSGSEDIAEGEIPVELWRDLQTFREEAERLAGCAWVKQDLPGSYRLHFEAGAMRVELIDAPSELVMREVLHCLRPFVLQSERLYYPRVSGHLFESMRHSVLRGLLSLSRDMFTGHDMRDVFTITRSDLELTTQEALDLWLDAFEYHRHGRDTTRRERFLQRHGGPPDDLATAVFRDHLRGKVLAILNLAGFVRGIETSSTYLAYEASLPKVEQAG